MTSKCDIGRGKGLDLDTVDDEEGENDLPGSICDRKATDTVIMKSMDIDRRAKRIMHVCKDHWLRLKDHYEYKTDPENRTYKTVCCEKHVNQTLRFVFRKGIR